MKDVAYFGMISAALEEAGIHRPALVVDLECLNDNLALVEKTMTNGPALRIVDKSLPSLPLLSHVMQRLGTNRIMTFHLPITAAVLEAFADAHVLFGKPMPAAAVASAFAKADGSRQQAFCDRVTWLIDTPERLAQYASLARSLGRPLRIAFEINIGMQRGGFDTPDALAHALTLLAGGEGLLRCEGLMGYEAHAPAIPALFGGPEVALASARKRYMGFVACLSPEQRKILNSGGSQTALAYAGDSLINDVSIGSALLKPVDFDNPALAGLKPALFLATPVLKVQDTRLPGPSFMTAVMQVLGQFPRRGCFIYGGRFMAEPVFPQGLRRNSLWGDSSNQQLLAMPAGCPLAPDDFVFFRPTQSEAVLQHFGPLQVLECGKIVREWPVLQSG